MKIEKRTFHINDIGIYKKTITAEDVQKFAEVTGDFCPIHVDEEFASQTRFGRCIVHGLLVSNLISTVMGMTLPGAGTIFLDQQVNFLHPTYIGDTITAQIRISDYAEKSSCYIVSFEGSCTNQKGERVISSKAHQMLPKEFFTMLP